MADLDSSLVVSEAAMCRMINISLMTCWRFHKAIRETGNTMLLPPFVEVGRRRKYPLDGIKGWVMRH